MVTLRGSRADSSAEKTALLLSSPGLVKNSWCSGTACGCPGCGAASATVARNPALPWSSGCSTSWCFSGLPISGFSVSVPSVSSLAPFSLVETILFFPGLALTFIVFVRRSDQEMLAGCSCRLKYPLKYIYIYLIPRLCQAGVAARGVPAVFEGAKSANVEHLCARGWQDSVHLTALPDNTGWETSCCLQGLSLQLGTNPFARISCSFAQKALCFSRFLCACCTVCPPPAQQLGAWGLSPAMALPPFKKISVPKARAFAGRWGSGCWGWSRGLLTGWEAWKVFVYLHWTQRKLS